MEAAAGSRQLAPGTMLDAKYRIDRLLAIGGMGAVYVGTHVQLRKRVAIKILNPQLSSPPMIERFHREAITASQIGHEGIAQVTDLGTSAEGEPFLVMEYLEGESLATRLKGTGPLAIEVACELGCAILSPLQAAHAAGIVHRDLKPDNVFLVRQSRGEMVKLLDFGISRAAGLEGEFRLTTTGLVLGTPYYMSPEQARGDSDVTPAADIYAFGVMLYEMLVGHVPLSADNYNQLMYRVMSGDFRPPREERPEIPVELEQHILHAMALQSAQRPHSAAELEQALLAFCRPTFREYTIERLSAPGLPAKTPPPHFLRPTPLGAGTDRTLLADSGAPPGGRPDTSTPTVASAPPAARRRSRAPWIAAGLVAVAAIGITAFAMSAGGGTGSPKDSGPAPAPSAPAPSAPAPSAPAPPAPVAPAPTAAPAPPPAPQTVTLRFSVDPKGAAITVDGKPVAGDELVVPKDGAAHDLVIAAPGRLPHTEQIKFDESQKLVVQLRVQAKAGNARPPRRDTRTDRIDTESPYK